MNFFTIKIKFLFCLFLFILLYKKTTGQGVHYGYPYEGFSIQKNDKFIVSMPIKNFWWFDEKGIEPLIEVLKKNPECIFNVCIYVYWGKDTAICLAISQSLKEKLCGLLEYKKAPLNYRVTPLGLVNPIFFDKSAYVLYFQMNTRMEIIVE